MTGWRLVSDAGGTNVRFARAHDGEHMQKYSAYPVSRFTSFSSALRTYLEETGGAAGCTSAAIGAAGRVDGGSVRLTNAAWTISEAAVSAELGVPCTLVNDVQAVAFSLPALSDTDFTVLGPLAPDLTKARRLLAANMGTGFGAATLVKTATGWTSCPSEAGHMTLAFPDWPDESLRRKFTSVEHVLSGRGLSNLHVAIANETATLPATEVLARVSADPNCAATLRLFTQIAGNVLGNLALAVAAWDGVFLCGSVAKGFVATADLDSLRQAFEAKGPMSEWMRRIPIALLTKEDAALAGLAALPIGACF
ncbi:MAG: ROK family protein [Rhodomicrobium sp.]|nr:ROK family protein [Rhodomicrobium sp.]